MFAVRNPGMTRIPMLQSSNPQQSLANRAKGEPIALRMRFNRREKEVLLIGLPPFPVWGIGSDSGVESSSPALTYENINILTVFVKKSCDMEIGLKHPLLQPQAKIGMTFPQHADTHFQPPPLVVEPQPRLCHCPAVVLDYAHVSSHDAGTCHQSGKLSLRIRWLRWVKTKASF